MDHLEDATALKTADIAGPPTFAQFAQRGHTVAQVASACFRARTARSVPFPQLAVIMVGLASLQVYRRLQDTARKT